MPRMRYGAPEGRNGEAVSASFPEILELELGTAFKLAEVAEKLGLSHRQVQAHIDDGSLVAINVGRGTERRNLRVLEEDLEGFARRRRTGVVRPVRTEPPPKPDPVGPKPRTYAERRAERIARQAAIHA